MTITFVDGNTYGPYFSDLPDKLVVDPNATVHATEAGTPALSLGSGAWELILNGEVTADDGRAVNLKSSGTFNSSVIVGSDGEISGGGPSGVGIAAGHATKISNGGSIKGGSTGILETGDGDFHIFNNGVIEGGSYGIHISGLGKHQVITNGTITGGTYAILGDSGMDWVANVGTLQGKVHLGDGNDILSNFIEEEGQRFDGKVTGVVDLGKGDDKFLGGKFAETVRDGDGKDELGFGAGNDLWFGFLAGGDDGTDTGTGDGGIDTYDASQAGVQGVAINLDTKAHDGHAALLADDFNALTAADQIAGFENAVGTNFADLLYGSAASNVLAGLAGDDMLFGFDSNDVLKGDSGLDTLAGGRGKDSLFGGADRDVFDFDSIKDSLKGGQRDVIQDFERGTDDIDLRTIDAKSGSGNQKFKFIGKQDFHDKKGELHFKDLGAKCLVSGDVNGDGKADFEILVKAGSLSAADFLL